MTSQPPRVAVAVSGGLDSTALLHCTARAAAGAGVEVHALHVHHGLQAQADDWMARVERQCRRWTNSGHPVQFHGHRILDRPARGDSLEAWARRQRYQALEWMARDAGCGLVILAHHRRDQAETVLLQTLRGGGPAGLSAMPRVVERQGLTWARPWLDQPREAIEAYARRWRLRSVVDPSNADLHLDRSRLRALVWPVLHQAFAHAETSLAAVSRRAQEARCIVDEVARADAMSATSEQGLQHAAWLGLSPARRANLLRHWLQRESSAAVPETLVQRLMAELPQACSARWPLPGGMVALHAGWLQVARAIPVHAVAPATIDLSRPGLWRAHPWPGAIRVDAVPQGSLPAALLTQAELRPRAGGEQFQLAPRSQARSLKKQYQALGVPAWCRQGPLVFAQGLLVFVPGLGIDARAGELPGAPRVTLRWEA